MRTRNPSRAAGPSPSACFLLPPLCTQYDGARIQLLDLPGIIEGASGGKGRGKQVIAVARTADVILMMLDATKGDKQKCAPGPGGGWPVHMRAFVRGAQRPRSSALSGSC